MQNSKMLSRDSFSSKGWQGKEFEKCLRSSGSSVTSSVNICPDAADKVGMRIRLKQW